MTRHDIERLPVVDEKDRLVDIVSRRDLLQVFLCSAEEIWQAVRREVFADALQVSPQISEVAVHDGAVTLTGQPESGAAPPSRRVRRARWTVSSTSWTTSPAASTTGTHRPADRPSTEWPTTGCAGHEPTDPPTVHRPCGHGGKGPRTWSRWPTDRGRSPAQPLVRLKGARTPAHWAPLPDGTYPTRINGGPAADHRRAHRRGVLPDGEPGRIGQAVPENLLPSRRPRIAPRRVKCPISRHPSPPDQAQVLGAARISDVTITVDQSQQARWVDVTGRCS